jgi:hypothetical protein
MVRHTGRRTEVFVNENHLGASVCLFHDTFCFAECQQDSEQGNQHSWSTLAFPSCNSFARMQLLPSCSAITKALPQIRHRLPVLFRNPGSVTNVMPAFRTNFLFEALPRFVYTTFITLKVPIHVRAWLASPAGLGFQWVKLVRVWTREQDSHVYGHLNLLAPEFGIKILAHPVCKMRIIQKQKKFNYEIKGILKRKKKESVQFV